VKQLMLTPKTSALPDKETWFRHHKGLLLPIYLLEKETQCHM